MNTLTIGVFVTALLVGFQTAHGVDFHVAPGGDDSHPGTEAEPFATLDLKQAKAYRVFAPKGRGATCAHSHRAA
jgi:hypothetical protein